MIRSHEAGTLRPEHAGTTVTLAPNTGSITSGGTATTNGSGLATFPSLKMNASGTYTLTAASTVDGET